MEFLVTIRFHAPVGVSNYLHCVVQEHEEPDIVPLELVSFIKLLFGVEAVREIAVSRRKLPMGDFELLPHLGFSHVDQLRVHP